MNTSERFPPASLLLVHGAGSGPWVYGQWPDSVPGLRVLAVDLQHPDQLVAIAALPVRATLAAPQSAAFSFASFALCAGEILTTSHVTAAERASIATTYSARPNSPMVVSTGVIE